jgi:hypothetical protein
MKDMQLHRKHPGNTVPCAATAYTIVIKLYLLESAKDRKNFRRRLVVNEEIFDDVGTRLEAGKKKKIVTSSVLQ